LSTEAKRLVALAEVARPHGVLGELRLRLYNADSDLLLRIPEVLLQRASGEQETRRVVRARRATGAILMTLADCADRSSAESLRGARLLVPRDVFPPPADGEFYVCDVEGAQVQYQERIIGSVLQFRSYPTCDVLVLRTDDGDFEVPLVDDSVQSIDVDAQIVRLTSLDFFEPV